MTATLLANFNEMQAIQTSAKMKYAQPFVITPASITPEKLSKLSTKYKDGKEKAATFAEMVSETSNNSNSSK